MNDRVTDQATAEVIGYGLELLPARIRERLEHVAWFTADPLFAGLHRYPRHQPGPELDAILDCPHHIMAEFLERPAEPRSTIVLPCPVEPTTIIHEAAHALHASIGWATVARPTIPEVTWYAETDYWEAWAEAFLVWCCPPEVLAQGWYAKDRLAGREVLAREGAEVVALFEELSL